MPTSLEAVRPIELAEIQEARRRIAHTIVRTPLVRLELGAAYPDIRLKLENLQPINAYKLRGAANAVAISIYVAYRFAGNLSRFLGASGIEVLVRLSAFILMCIGIEFLWSGYLALKAAHEIN